MSFSRPHVSDDNPHVESSFSTLKGDRTYPKVFDDIEHAHSWIKQWIEFYNTTRHHPGLAYFTPVEVLTGTWRGTWRIRNAHCQQLFKANPKRYQYRRPFVPKPTSQVQFNVHNTPDNITNRRLVEMITME